MMYLLYKHKRSPVLRFVIYNDVEKVTLDVGSWIWRWARALNFFGRPWQGLFWVEPVLLNRCMVLATVLQLSFRVLAIFL